MAKSSPQKGVPDQDPGEDGRKAYEAANERAEALRAEWDRLGKPFLAEGGATGKATVPHPLMRMMYDAETLAARLRKELGKKQMGRPAETVPRAAPSQLRSVK